MHTHEASTVHLLNTCLFFGEEVELFQTVRRKTLHSMFFIMKENIEANKHPILCEAWQPFYEYHIYDGTFLIVHETV